ncbi:MAG: hypothetical protein U0136_07580 [Bdellovibrionota bacterium]
MLKRNLAVVAMVLLTTGCSDRKNLSPLPSVSTEAKAALNAPVNCSTARQDLKVLEDEEASVAKQILAGVRSVMPIAAAAGLLMGDYRDRASVATGQYNADLEAKQNQIKQQCGIK